MEIRIEIILLVLSILFFLSILAGKASSKYGVPALLLFAAIQSVNVLADQIELVVLVPVFSVLNVPSVIPRSP